MNRKEKYNMSILGYASYYGWLSTVELLLDRNEVDLDLKLSYNGTALIFSCKSGHASIVDRLI